MNSRDKAKRTLIKSLLTVGSGTTLSHALPEKWIRPTLSSIIIPSHAATSTNAVTNLIIEALGGNTANVDFEFGPTGLPAGTYELNTTATSDTAEVQFIQGGGLGMEGQDEITVDDSGIVISNEFITSGTIQTNEVINNGDSFTIEISSEFDGGTDIGEASDTTP